MFKRNSGFDGGKKFGGNGGYVSRPRTGASGGFGARDGVRPDLHQAVCVDCGKQCQVPFKPNGRKPIFCRDCFQKDGNGGGDGKFAPSGSARPSFVDRRPREFAPRYEAPRSAAPAADGRIDEMNAKLDRILREIEALKELKG